MSASHNEQIRAIARRLAEKARNDPAFREQIMQDPQSTLTSAGLSEQAIADFLRETGLGDVSGYMLGPLGQCGLSLI